MGNLEKLDDYPKVEVIEWDQFPDYIRYDISRQDEWYVYQFGYLKKYLHKVLMGWSITDFFPNTPAEKIAVYSLTIFTDEIVSDLKRKTNKSIFVSDKAIENARNISKDMRLITPDKLLKEYQIGNISKVIVSGIFHENKIMDELLEKGFKLNDIVTVCNILVQ